MEIHGFETLLIVQRISPKQSAGCKVGVREPPLGRFILSWGTVVPVANACTISSATTGCQTGLATPAAGPGKGPVCTYASTFGTTPTAPAKTCFTRNFKGYGNRIRYTAMVEHIQTKLKYRLNRIHNIYKTQLCLI